jgi:fused signal recognition particle receptor
VPHSLEATTVALLVLAATALVLALALDRLPATGADPIAPLVSRLLEHMSELRLPSWMAAADVEGRRGFLRRRAAAREERDDDHERPEEAEPEPASAGERPRMDHIPLEPRSRDGEDGGRGRLRDRLRRGLRKTRDFLDRDMREVVGAGPVEESFDMLEEALVRADIGVATAMSLASELRGRRDLNKDTLPVALREGLRAQLATTDRRLRVNPGGLSVWLVVGVNGTGKTTSVAKLAAHAKSHGLSVCIAAADTFRAAAIEQLETWAKRVKVDLVRQHPGADPAAVVFDAIEHARARGQDLVIADTAGRLHTRTPLMEELKKVRRVIERDTSLLTETLLVLDATTGQNGIAQAKAFRDAIAVSGLVLAKLDGTAKGGIVIAVERELGIPVKAVGLGEKADDLAGFDPDAFVEALFGS